MAAGVRPPVVAEGDQFGRLVVLAYDHSANNRRHYLCRCECGAEVVVVSKLLRNGHTLSCGCLLHEARHVRFGRRNAIRERTHGHTVRLTRTRTYRSWEAMKRRCLSPGSVDYPRYGGAGVTVCDAWLTFEGFLADMGERPEGRTLDRVDPYGNYEPGNCRWATGAVQRANRRQR